ncbi:MAG: hypothetical protein ACKPKO_45325, partial [Candidatus Fonsibacter sp.]
PGKSQTHADIQMCCPTSKWLGHLLQEAQYYICHIRNEPGHKIHLHLNENMCNNNVEKFDLKVGLG